MRVALRWAVLVFVGFGAGCAWRGEVLRRASTDLECPEGSVELSREGDVVRVQGCEKRAVYAQKGDGWELTDFREPASARQARAKQLATADLRCPAERIEVTSLEDLQRAQGCNRIVLYDGRTRDLKRIGYVVPICRREGESTDQLAWERDAAPASRVGPEIAPELPPAYVATHCRTEVSEFRCNVETTGRVSKCCAVMPVPFTEWAVAEALLRTEYRPALEAGKAVEKQYIFKTTLRPAATCSGLE